MPQWNTLFTTLIRERDPRLWGNWGLSGLRIGALGVLTTDGAFRPIGKLKGVKTAKSLGSEDWRMSTKHVRRSQTTGNVSGGASGIPAGTTGGSVEASIDLQIKWEFGEAQEMVSEFNVSAREYIDNLAEVVQNNQKQIDDLADSVGMRTAGSIDQGFGFISGIVWAKSGANIASLTTGSSFSISGKADAVASMLGGPGGNGTAQAGYSHVNEEGNLDKHLWPATGETAEPSLVPIGFYFSSFEGSTHIPGWIGYIQNIVIEIHNRGSWISSAVVEYCHSAGVVKEEYKNILGAQSRQIIMPIDATDVVLTVKFIGAKPLTRNIPNPLAQSPNGRFHFHIEGLCPDGPFLKSPE